MAGLTALIEAGDFARVTDRRVARMRRTVVARVGCRVVGAVVGLVVGAAVLAAPAAVKAAVDAAVNVAVNAAVIASANDTPQGSVTLSLAEAIALAERANPRITAAMAQLDAAQFGVTTARAYPNPTTEIDVGSQRGRAEGVRSGALGSFGVIQPIDLPSVRAPRAQGAEAGVAASAIGLEETRIAVRAQVAQAFNGVLVRRAEVALAEGNRALLEDIRNRVAVRMQVGEAPRLELTRADAELSGARNAETSARLRASDALAGLKAAIGAPGLDRLDVTGDLGAPPSTLTLDALREEVLAAAPVLKRSAAETRQAQARLELERALRAPQPAIRFGVGQDPETREARVGLALQVPLWNRREGPIGQAASAVREARAVEDVRRIELMRGLESAWGRYRVATEQIAAFESGLLRQAEAALAVAQSAYRFGERGFLEVLDAQRVLRTTRFEYLAARAEQGAAWIDIERLRASR